MKPKPLHFPAFIALALVMPASADVIYSNFQNITIPATYDGLYLDVDGPNGWSTDMAAPVAGWDINPFYGGKVLANSPAFQPVRSTTGNTSAIVNLAVGGIVDTSSVFSSFVQGALGETPGAPGYGTSQTLTSSGGNFTAGSEGYLGFKLFTGANYTAPVYGWMRVVFTDNAAGAVIKDWAYDTSGAAMVTGRVQQSAAVSGAQTVTLSPGIGESFTLGSLVSDTGGNVNNLVKTGAGTTVLSQANTHTGGTSVTGGTLLVNNTTGSGTGSGAVTVTGGTLGGVGTIAGAVNVSTGGIISPGSGAGDAGNLTLNNGLDLQGGIFSWDLTSLSTTPGTGSDQLTITTGTVDITGAALGLNLGSNAPSAIPFWQTTQTWAGIINHTGTGSLDTLSGTFAAIDNTPWSSLGSFTTTYTGNDVNLVWSAVPEPSNLCLVGGLGLLALLRRRR